MPTFDVCIYPDSCVHIVVEADDKEAAKDAAMVVFETEIDRHASYVKDGQWVIEDVAQIDPEENDDDETD